MLNEIVYFYILCRNVVVASPSEFVKAEIFLVSLGGSDRDSLPGLVVPLLRGRG